MEINNLIIYTSTSTIVLLMIISVVFYLFNNIILQFCLIFKTINQ